MHAPIFRHLQHIYSWERPQKYLKMSALIKWNVIVCQCEAEVSHMLQFVVLEYCSCRDNWSVVDKALIINLFPPTLLQAADILWFFFALDGHQKQQHCCLQLPCCLSATVATVCVTLTHLKCFLSHPHTLSYTLNTFSLSPRWHFGASSERHCPFVYFLWPHINFYSFLFGPSPTKHALNTLLYESLHFCSFVYASARVY